MYALREWTVKIQVYEIQFSFRRREGWPAAAVLTAFRKTGDDVIQLLDYLGRDNFDSIRLTTMEEINHE